MDRKFTHTFNPKAEDPTEGAQISLSVESIENAGLREVLQTPGAKFGTWALLESLLAPTDSFSFIEPLGQAREVKVALSGLFGRSVARAYLEKYFNSAAFNHVSPSFLLNKKKNIWVMRARKGDLPDWVVTNSSYNEILIAEAKGCHDRAGPKKSLARAWKQTTRSKVVLNGKRVPVKRIAITTRWGYENPSVSEPIISVHDPLDDGDNISPEEMDAVHIGLVRLHLANLLEPLGYESIARALINLTESDEATDKMIALQEVEHAGKRVRLKTPSGEERDDLIGRVVTRAGVVKAREVTIQDQEVLSKLDFRPTFVGIGRKKLVSAIAGKLDSIRSATRAHPDDKSLSTSHWTDDDIRGVVIPLGPEHSSILDD
ncbi:MAG: hypothetical protein IPK59_20345 [Rhodospirillaceae bacterium]|nr:hypothetical protein [Rhodospirillaceae bacterium]